MGLWLHKDTITLIFLRLDDSKALWCSVPGVCKTWKKAWDCSSVKIHMMNVRFPNCEFENKVKAFNGIRLLGAALVLDTVEKILRNCFELKTKTVEKLHLINNMDEPEDIRLDMMKACFVKERVDIEMLLGEKKELLGFQWNRSISKILSDWKSQCF